MKTPEQPKPFISQLAEENTPRGLDAIPEPVHPSKTTKWVNRTILIALLAIAIGLAIMLRWSLANTEVIKVNNAPFPVRTIRQHAEQGGVVILSIDACKSSNIKGVVRTSFVSTSREIFLPQSKEQLPKGCFKQEVPILVPKDLPADTYKIKFHATYNLNPLKTAVVNEFVSTEFQINPNLPTTP